MPRWRQLLALIDREEDQPWLCQVGVARTGIASDETATQPFGLGTGHLTPNPEGTCAQEAMVDGSQQVAAGAKEILHEAVHR